MNFKDWLRNIFILRECLKKQKKVDQYKEIDVQVPNS